MTFNLANNFIADGFSEFVTVGDFNEDNNLDLIVASGPGQSSISLLLGDGTGLFSAPTIVFQSTGNAIDPDFIVVEDVNRDNDLDVLVVNRNSDNVSVILGQGDGTFLAPTFVRVDNDPTSIAVGDINRDNNLDLIASNFSVLNNDTVSVILGIGGGDFAPRTDFSVGHNPAEVGVGDFNEDGNLDLITANSTSTNNIALLLGDGTGAFSPANFLTVSNTADSLNSLVIADFNQDNNLDIAVTDSDSGNSSGNDNDVYVLLGNGDGTFYNAIGYEINGSPRDIDVADFNFDGNLDLVVASVEVDNNDHISVLFGDGTGGFSVPIDYPTARDPVSVVVGDFNRDNRIDVATANSAERSDLTGNNISILINNFPTTGNTGVIVVNPIADVVVDEDAPKTAIDLSNVFVDIDNDPISFTIFDNTNQRLVNPSIENNQLTLEYIANQFGQAEIMIEATAGGESVRDTFLLTVNSVDETTTPPNSNNGQLVNRPLLPILTRNSVFQFNFKVSDRTRLVWIDPEIAIGYDYIVNSGANISNVQLPTDVAGDDGVFDLFLPDQNNVLVDSNIDLQVNQNYSFVENGFPDGVTSFGIRGIDESVRLDPEDPLAFVTGLQFVEEGEVNLNQNPVTIEAPLDTTFNRFQNEDVQGTFLFATEEESVNIRRDFPQFNEEGQAFNVATEPSDGLVRFNRFQNSQVEGTFLFATEEESVNIRRDFPQFNEEGIAFYAYPKGSGQADPFYRFQNSQQPGTYIFVTEQEKQNILTNFPQFVEEGIAFEATMI